MKEILRTTDPTQIAFAEALLSAKGINCFVLDVNISVLEGGIGILPRRLAVIDSDAQEAWETLKDNNLPVAQDPPR